MSLIGIGLPIVVTLIIIGIFILLSMISGGLLTPILFTIGVVISLAVWGLYFGGVALENIGDYFFTNPIGMIFGILLIGIILYFVFFKKGGQQPQVIVLRE